MKAMKCMWMPVLLGLVFTACEKDDFTLAPDDSAQLREYAGEIQPAEVVRITSKVRATILRNDTERPFYLEDDIAPDMDSKPAVSPDDQFVSYTVQGFGEAVNEFVGWASISVDLSSNHRTRELTGFITLQSMDEKVSRIRFRAFGYSDIQPIGNTSGVSFRLEVIEASGAYASIDRYANAVLTGYVDDLYRHEAESTPVLQINMVMRPVLTY